MKRLFIITILVVAGMAALAVSVSGNGSTSVVSCLGDSITEGFPYSGTENTYPARLQVMLDAAYGVGSVEVVNHGVSGWRADQVRDHVQGWMAEDNPDYVLLLVGGNDLAQLQSIESTVAEVQAIVDLVTAHTNPDDSHPQIIVSAILPNLISELATAWVSVYNDSLESDLTGVDLWFTDNWDGFYNPATGQADAALMADLVHPNVEGYMMVAENWFQGLDPPCDLPGDLNCDCVVDIADIMLVASRWHTSVGNPDYHPAYDLNDDGKIDIVDIMLVAVHWGETCPISWSPIGASGGGWLTAIAISGNDPDVVYVGCDVGGIYKSTDNGASWQIINNGLTNYYIQDIVIDPQTPTTLYAATQGGVFKSTDGGDTWVIKRNGFTPVSRYTFSAPVAKILVDPTNPNIVYAGVGTPHHEGHQSVYWLGVVEKGVVYKSTDYGETWTKIRNTGIDTNAMIYSMAIDHHDPAVLYINTDYGVYKSTDAGSSWQSKNTGLPHLHTRDIIIDPTNSNVLYLTVWATPGSASWEGGVYKSTDAAESWVAKNDGLAQAMGDPSESSFLTSNYKNIVINPQNPQILYVANTSWWPEPGIFKTTDGGDDWTWVTRNEEPNINVDLGWIDWGPQAYCLAIDPDDPDRLFFGTDGVICKTEDAGESWMQVYTDPVASAYWQGKGFETTCVMDVAVDPANPDNVYVGYCDIGFLKSTDGGTSFKKTENGMNYPANTFTIAIDPDNPNVLYIGTGDLLTWGINQGEICKSTDYGETWTAIGDPGNGLPDAQVWSLAIDPNSNPDSRTLYAVSYQSGIYKTTDGGASWFAVNNGLGINRNIRKIVIDPTDSNTLYVGIEGYDEGLATVQGGIYKTSDGGQNWVRIDTNPPQPSVLDLAIDPSSTNVIYSASREHYDHTQQVMYLGSVYKSTDGGSNWTRLNSGFGDSDNLNVGALAINPQNPEIIYAGTFDDNFHDESSGRGIFKSTDGGANWTPMNDGLGILYTTVITIDPSDHSRLYVGTHGNSVFTRTDD